MPVGGLTLDDMRIAFSSSRIPDTSPVLKSVPSVDWAQGMCRSRCLSKPVFVGVSVGCSSLWHPLIAQGEASWSFFVMCDRCASSSQHQCPVGIVPLSGKNHAEFVG